MIESHHASGHEHRNRIINVPGYLFSVARNLMLDEFKRKRSEVDIADLELASGEPTFIESRILVSEIVRRMNSKSRTIFRYRTLGYEYREIAKEFKKAGHRATEASLRSEFSKAIKQIVVELEGANRENNV